MWDVDATTFTEYQGWCTAEEDRRYAGFLNDRRRREFVVGRGLARRALAQEVGCLPSEIRFGVEEQGKLKLAWPGAATDIYFNITHTADYVACAVCRANSIGIDVEKLHSRTSARDIAERFFSLAESQFLRTLSDAQVHDWFFTIWTLKEALAKAHGLGLAAPLESSRFDIGPGGRIEASTVYPPFLRGTWLACCSPTQTHRLAICVLCDEPTLVTILPQKTEYSGDIDASGFSWVTMRLNTT